MGKITIPTSVRKVGRLYEENRDADNRHACVYWYKNGELYRQDRMADMANLNLEIYGTSYGAEGTYHAVIMGKKFKCRGLPSRSIDIEVVVGEPPIFIQTAPKVVKVSVGSNLTLEFEALGTPKVTYKWFEVCV